MLPQKEETKNGKSVSLVLYIITIITILVLAIICLLSVRNYYENQINAILIEQTNQDSIPTVDINDLIKQQDENGNNSNEIDDSSAEFNTNIVEETDNDNVSNSTDNGQITEQTDDSGASVVDNGEDAQESNNTTN